MGVATVTFAVASVVGAIIIHLVSTELYAMGSSLARKAIKRAASRLPAREKERYEEEWLAHYHECSGTIAQLWHAVGCMIASSAIARVSLKRAEGEDLALARLIDRSLWRMYSQARQVIDSGALNRLEPVHAETITTIEQVTAALRDRLHQMIKLGFTHERLNQFGREVEFLSRELLRVAAKHGVVVPSKDGDADDPREWVSG